MLKPKFKVCQIKLEDSIFCMDTSLTRTPGIVYGGLRTMQIPQVLIREVTLLHMYAEAWGEGREFCISIHGTLLL